MIAGLPSEQEGVSDTEARYWWDKVLSDETKRKFIVSLLKDKERQKDYYILTSTPFDEFTPKIKARLKLWLVNSDSKDLKAKKGIYLKGKRHYEGGIPVEVEDGEMIINRKSGKIKDKIICEGTGEGIGSALNELGGGVKWSNEGKCNMEKSKKYKEIENEIDSAYPTDAKKVNKIIQFSFYDDEITAGDVVTLYRMWREKFGSDIIDDIENEDELRKGLENLEKGGISKAKAKKILHDGKIRGKKLTDKQRKFFGARASGYPKKEFGGIEKERTTLSEEEKQFIREESQNSGQGFTYRPKILFGQQIILKEKGNTPIQKYYVDNYQIAKKISDKLNSINEKESGKIRKKISSKMKIKNKIKEGNYELGGYAGKTQEEIWDGWASDQRRHFLFDHNLDENYRTDDYSELPENVKQELKGHTMMGQYEQGGKPKEYFKINEPKEFEILEKLLEQSFRIEKCLKTSDILILNGSETLANFLDKTGIHYTVFENKQELDSYLLKQLPKRIQNKII